MTRSFKQVPRAYKPSGRTTHRGIFLIVLTGLVVLTVLVCVAYLVQDILSPLWAVILVQIALPGLLVGYSLRYVGRIGKNRNQWIIVGTAFVTIIAFLALSPLAREAGLWEGDWWKSWIVLAIPLGLGLWITSIGVTEKPFCEECGKYMVCEGISCPSIFRKEDALELLGSNSYTELMTQFPYFRIGRFDGSKYKYMKVSLWHCQSCYCGYVDGTFVIEGVGEDNSDNDILLYSSAVRERSVKEILSAQKRERR